MKLDKADRRDRKNLKRRTGMRMHGKDISLLWRAQEKRDRSKKRRKEDRDAQ